MFGLQLRFFNMGATQKFMLTILETLQADPQWDTAGKVYIHLHCASSMCAARANHGIVSFHGGRVFVIGRLCEGFACMLQLVTKVFVLMVFGVRARRTDRMDCWDPRRWHGTWVVRWTGDSGASAQLVFGLCQTRGHCKTGRENSDTFRPARCQTETNRSQGTTSWKNS